MIREEFYTVANTCYEAAGVIKCNNIKRCYDVIRYVFAVRLKDVVGNTVTLDVTDQINNALRKDGFAVNKSNAYLFRASFKNQKVLLSDDHNEIKDIERYLPSLYDLKKRS